MGIHVRTALASVRRSPFQAFSAIFVLTLTFFVATLFSIIIFSSSRLLNYFETRPQIISFLKLDANDNDIATLQHKLEADDRIKEVKYVSKEDALSIYKKATSSNPQLGELVNPSIFPSSLEFSVKDLSFAKDVIDEVKSEKIVDSVGFTASIGDDSNLSSVVSRLKTITNYVRIGGLILTLVLGFTSFIVLLIIVSMRLSTRKEEIEILNLLGATPKFIRSPIVIEALFYSTVGVVFGWLLAFIGVLYIAPSAVAFFGEISILPRGFMEIIQIFGIVLGAELLFGFIIAYMGSFLAVSRAKRVR